VGNETNKAHAQREANGDYERYLRGEGIDIGCGPDPLRIPHGTVQTWDLMNGDAQLMAGVDDCSFDFVYSSHCLEHMRDVKHALANWRRIVKPGGFVYVVVPEWTLYEQRQWPSLHNDDHKASFAVISCCRPQHQHFTVADMSAMPGLKLLDVRLDMTKFVWAEHSLLPPFVDQTSRHNAQAQVTYIFERCP
jgi:SAM-dependent methyltransferase